MIKPRVSKSRNVNAYIRVATKWRLKKAKIRKLDALMAPLIDESSLLATQTRNAYMKLTGQQMGEAASILNKWEDDNGTR